MQSKIMICKMCEDLAGMRGEIFLFCEEDQWRSDQPVICFSQNFSVLIGILVRQTSRVQKENKVLLAHADEIPLSLNMTLQSRLQALRFT